MTPERRDVERAGFEEGWRSRFHDYAESSDDDAGIAGWSTTGLDARVRRFQELWKPCTAGRWLDAGCGAGTYSRLMRLRGLEVVAVDYSLPTLRKAAARGLDTATLAVADVRRLPFRPGTFDGALCLGVTQALAESAGAVRELAAQVKPGGELWLDALNRWCVVHAYDLLKRRVRGYRSHLRYESPIRLKRTLEVAGFTKVQVYWMPILPSRWYGLQKLIESRPVAALLRFLPLLGPLLSHAFIIRAERATQSDSGY